MNVFVPRELNINALGVKANGEFKKVWNYYVKRMSFLIQKLCLKQKENEWTFSLWLNSILRAYEITKEKEYVDLLQHNCSKLLEDDGTLRIEASHSTQLMLGYTILKLYEITTEERWLKGANNLLKSIVPNHSRSDDGCLTYFNGSQYVLVDTLAMACPFLIASRKITANTQYEKQGVKQLLCFIEKETDPKSKLPYHGYHVSAGSHLGLLGWGRGTGWLIMGIVDSIAELNPGPLKNQLCDFLLQLVKTIIHFQKEDGHWSWYLPMKNEASDSSVTSLIGYSLARSYQIGVLDDNILPTLNSAAEALLDCQNKRLRFIGSSGECTGLGNYSMEFSAQSWLQSTATCFLLIWGEIKKKKTSIEIL